MPAFRSLADADAQRTAALLPSLCAVCRGWGRRRVCGDCMARYAAPRPRCRRCALAVAAGNDVCGACLIEPPPHASAVAALDYAHPWDGLITRFKFHDGLDLAPVLSHLLSAAITRCASVAAPDLVLPVPLSDLRLRERGYNQAWELARRVARAFSCESDAHLLLRVKDTPHQLALPPEQRAGNVRAAFAVEPRRAAELQGHRVALVDDVMTTGATAAEAARTLLQAGAAAVEIWTLARTPRPDEA